MDGGWGLYKGLALKLVEENAAAQLDVVDLIARVLPVHSLPRLWRQQPFPVDDS